MAKSSITNPRCPGRRQFLRTAAGGAAGLASVLALRQPPAYAQTRELTFLTIASFVPETDKELKRQFEEWGAKNKVKVRLDSEIAEVRPGFTCTSEVTTATRKDVVAVPIQATTVREMVIDDKGTIVRDQNDGKRPRPGAVQASELKPGQSRKELEGVFVVRDGVRQDRHHAGRRQARSHQLRNGPAVEPAVAPRPP